MSVQDDAIHQSRILILDFGSQYTQLIARRVRELGVYCEIHPFDMNDKALRSFKPSGIILSGGPNSVAAQATPQAPQAVFSLACPVLGICYGMQTMAQQLGGQVARSQVSEFGYAQVQVVQSNALFSALQDACNEQGDPLLDVWMSHGDHVEVLPPGFTVSGASKDVPIVAMADESRHYYGLQFHPEVTHTKQGQAILGHFVRDVCVCEALWKTDHICDALVAQCREQVGDQHVLLGLSGGVDSSVVAALLHRAIGAQLTCVFVNNGLLRLNEQAQVEAVFSAHMHVNVVYVDAKDQFLSALQGVSDPEQKRKVIGRVFIEVFEQEAKKLKGVSWLAQGTIYPDVIESAATSTGTAHTIKSHHNVGGLPERMHLSLLEPLRELFKDEVRQLGLALGLPKQMIYRHPFPGPGLGVRILGEVRESYAQTLRLADAIFIEALERSGWYDKVSQAFAVFLPVKSVGVKGDARCYAEVIALRAVETVDFMTARWSQLPYELIAEVSNRIINEVPGVSRVVYDVSGKPPATIEWE
jgi:GMP synthase (glutamine-hydrolysing)